MKIEPGEDRVCVSDARVALSSETPLAGTTVQDPASSLAGLDPLVVFHRKTVLLFHWPDLCRDAARPDFNCSTLTSVTAYFQQGFEGGFLY